MAIFPFVPGRVDTTDTTLLRTPWDTVQLGQFTLPGISTVQISRPRKYSIKTAKDKSYATVKDTGLELAKITITNVIGGVSYFVPQDSTFNATPLMTKYESQLSTLEDILQFFDTQLGIKTKSTTDGQAISGFSVNHPALQMRGINSLYIEDIDGPHTSRPGFITTTFKCIEIRNAKETTTKKVDPGKSFAQGSAFTNPTQNTPPSQNPAATAPKRK